MDWAVLSTSYTHENVKDEKWLDDFIESPDHSFTKIPIPPNAKADDWHNRKTRTSSTSDWLTYWKQTGNAWDGGHDGFITVFPQLPVLLGLRKKFSLTNKPLIAWLFNVGEIYTGPKQQLAKLGLSQVDKFIVHTSREIELYSDWLSLPADKFEFFPLQSGKIHITETENTDDPFLLSMGTALRDYKTLFAAVKKLNIRTKVVAGPRATDGLEVPNNVELISGITLDACRKLSQQARLCVIPMQESVIATGQVTIIESMSLGRPIIVTNCNGAEDYIEDEKTGLFVAPNSVDSMTDAISTLWEDEKARKTLAKNAAVYAEQNFTDAVASAKLKSVLDSYL